MLAELGIQAIGYVTAMRDVAIDLDVTDQNIDEVTSNRDASSMYCPDADATAAMEQFVREAKEQKDTVGGLCRVHVLGSPMGLGTCMTRSDGLDAKLAAAVMSIQAFKSVEIGLGRDVALRWGSEVHDAISFDPAQEDTPCRGFVRKTNRAGGIEGGMSNGQPIVVTGAMKPISTLLRGLPSVNLQTNQPEHSDYERSDVCAVSAASVVMQHAVTFEIAAAVLEKFGGDTMDELRSRI